MRAPGVCVGPANASEFRLQPGVRGNFSEPRPARAAGVAAEGVPTAA